MRTKKILAILAAVCFVFTVLPMAVFADGGAAVTIEGSGTTALTDILGQTDFGDVISFTMYDANGDKITYTDVLDMDRTSATYLTQLTTPEAKATVAKQGWTNANTAGSGFVEIVEQPANSAITEADLTLEWVGAVLTIKSAKEITEEGTYTFKVTLDNGASADASCEVMGFRTPVQLRITGTTCVERGAPAYLKATWYDENGVPKNATDSIEWTVTGAADYHWLKAAARYAIIAGADESYAGSTIEVSVNDTANGLTANHTVRIAAAGEKTLVWDSTEAATGAENTYSVTLIDANGAAVKLCCCSATTEFIVLDQPSGSDVSVTSSWKGSQGQSGTMTLVSDTPGEVTVQATVSFVMTDMEVDADGNAIENEAGTLSYTTVETFTVTGAPAVAAAGEKAPQTFDISVVLAFAAAAGMTGLKVFGKKRS